MKFVESYIESVIRSHVEEVSLCDHGDGLCF